MTRLIVEAGFGYTVAQAPTIGWTDISQYVDVVTGVSIGRGASDEVSEIQPATCSMVLDDSDGRFTPGRATSPYWPSVRKNTPIRVSVAVLESPSSTAIAGLVDNFDDNVVNTTLWPGSFGGVSEVGGRARVPCTTGFAAYKSAQSWTMPGSQVTVKVPTIPAVSTGTDVTAAMRVNSLTDGTRVGFRISPVSGTLQCHSEVGYVDGSAVSLTYSATTHAWLRMRETAGTLYWETSPDGYAWTVRRSAATPAWVTSQPVSLSLESHRDAGVSDFAEFDMVGGAAPYTPIAQLSDDFDDNKVNTALWSANFGGATEVNGRARVPAAAGLTGGYQSARQWTLTGSQTTVRLLTVPSPTGATTATCTFMVTSVTSGTRIGFIVNTVSGLLQCRNDVGFSDGAPVNVAYSATTHAWLRMREASGTVYWETSPDGYTWTIRRSVATPAWVGTDPVVLQMSATRDAGTTDFAEYDLVGATVHPRFYGMVNEWPLKLKGLQATTTITCTDLFKWLSGQPSLQPMLSEEILYSGALAYYPLSEDASATSAGDLAANGATALSVVQMGSGGTLAFAGSTGPAETGQSAPLFTPATASAGQYLKADLGPAAATATATQAGYIELWIQTSTTGRTFLASATADGTYQVVYGLQASTGLLEMRWTLDPTAAIVDWGTGVDLSSGNLADGKLHHLVIGLFTADLWVDGVASNLPFGSKQPMRTMYLGGFIDGRLWAGTISNVALYASSSLTGTTLAPHYNAGATGYAGEAANLRIQRLAKYVNIATVTPVGSTFDPQASQGPGGSTALAMMQAVATTESARLSASRDAFGLTLMSRDIRYNPVAGVSLSYPDLDTGSVEHSDDDQKMVNSVVASRPGGATQRVISQASIDAYGPKEQPLDLLKTSDNSVLDAANWLISRYSDPPPELREIPIEAYTMGAATYRALLGLGISSVLTVTDLPDQAPASVQTVFVEGYTETIRQASHLLSFHTSRSYNDSAWVLDDPTYSTLGSTTKLAY